MPEELLRNQSIPHFDVMLQPDWPIKQCLLHIRVFLGGKTKSACFEIFIHWLIKQIMNTYQNYFSRSYENCYNHMTVVLVPGNMLVVKNKKECSREFVLGGLRDLHSQQGCSPHLSHSSMDDTFHWINFYPVDKAIGSPVNYSLDINSLYPLDSTI